MKTVLALVLCSIYSFVLQAQTDTVYTKSGLKYLSLLSGNGPNPNIGNRVKITYVGKLLNGEVFQALEAGDVFFFKVGDPTIILGMNEGVQLMKQGEKARFVIPPFLGYGSKGVKDPEGEKEFMVPPNATLVFDIELLSVK